MIANQFKIDPVAVLESNQRNWNVRVVAYEIALKEESKQASKGKGTVKGLTGL